MVEQVGENTSREEEQEDNNVLTETLMEEARENACDNLDIENTTIADEEDDPVNPVYRSRGVDKENMQMNQRNW